jgi:hypothetical protein
VSEIKDGGPAFPIADQGFVHRVGAAAIEGITDVAERDRLYIEATARACAGMTLRDYFAAKAMQGICAHPDTWGNPIPQIAELSYEMADAMIRARSQS